MFFIFFFFNDTATTEIYTLSLHDALPISRYVAPGGALVLGGVLDAEAAGVEVAVGGHGFAPRSEEHTSELQSQSNLVCRLLLEKKKNRPTTSVNRDRQLTLITQLVLIPMH